MKQLDKTPVYDLEYGLSMVAGRKDIHEAMLRAALGVWQDNGGMAPLLDRTRYRSDPMRMGELAHRGIGSCRMCGMLRLADYLAAISNACDAGKLDTAESVGACLPELLRVTRERITPPTINQQSPR